MLLDKLENAEYDTTCKECRRSLLIEYQDFYQCWYCSAKVNKVLSFERKKELNDYTTRFSYQKKKLAAILSEVDREYANFLKYVMVYTSYRNNINIKSLITLILDHKITPNEDLKEYYEEYQKFRENSRLPYRPIEIDYVEPISYIKYVDPVLHPINDD